MTQMNHRVYLTDGSWIDVENSDVNHTSLHWLIASGDREVYLPLDQVKYIVGGNNLDAAERNASPGIAVGRREMPDAMKGS